jgi:hypothetical protein
MNQTSLETPLLYASRLDVVDRELRHLFYTDIPGNLTFGDAVSENVLTGCTMAFNRTLARLVSRSQPENMVMHDWWLYLIAAGCGKVVFDPIPNILYRQHGSNAVGAGPGSKGLARWVLKLKPLFSNPQKRSAQLREFLSVYRKDLAPSAVAIAESLVGNPGGLAPRIQAALQGSASRQSFRSTLLLRLEILLGRY